jgi:hypothetical protein
MLWAKLLNFNILYHSRSLSVKQPGKGKPKSGNSMLNFYMNKVELMFVFRNNSFLPFQFYRQKALSTFCLSA